MFDSFRTAWLRVGRWPQLIAAATCLLLAALTALNSARDRAAARAPVRTVSVVVTTHAIGAGRILHSADVRIEQWPVNLHPPPTPHSVRAVIGRRCAGALTAREPLTAPRVLGAGITTGLAAGLGAVPITVAGGRSAEYVRVGDQVDVLAGPSDTLDEGAARADAQLVASGATVLSVLPGGDGEAAVVVIAADRATALRAARQQASRTFTVVLISPP
ncbi:SAF domain-containing protein [uncultured Jatrophihabitans sp.]|uniref:SAF domain-containing protein n=1 Tax=uncultured Jatrophihabitans sp. TaxID=1610747 RepID=UPI0035C96420